MSELYKIIVADDEDKIREGLVNLFPWKELGFEIAADFRNGQEVMDYLYTHRDIHVILTDIQMPVMDGVGLSSVLRDSDIKIVFFSSYQDFHYAQSAIQNHVFDYLPKPVKYQSLVSCFERLRAELNKKSSPDTAAKAELPPLPSRDGGRAVPVVKEYIRRHYRDCSLEAAAALVFLSPSYLSTIFAKQTGTTFTDYLKSVRMEEACRMLKEPDIKQYEIAFLIGYDNPKNFTRAFRTYYGCTPQEYRARLNDGNSD